MNLLQTCLNMSELLAKDIPKSAIICTHAKKSSVMLCKTMQDIGVSVTFYPVDYSKDPNIIDELLALGVSVTETVEGAKAAIKKADFAIEDGARISKLIQAHNIKTKKLFYSVEQTSGGIRYFEEYPPSYPVIDVAISPITNPIIHDTERTFRLTGERPRLDDTYWNEMLGHLRINET